MSAMAAHKSNTSPATELLKDKILMDQGHLTLAQLRGNWRAGKYAGVNADWAAWCIR